VAARFSKSIEDDGHYDGDDWGGQGPKGEAGIISGF